MSLNNKLGTLGDDNGYLSCSMFIAKSWGKYNTIIPYSTFEKAAQDLKLKKLSSILVPAAYHNISEFIMDSELKVNDLFLKELPPLVYVSKKCYNKKLNLVNKIYIHPATYKLLDDININLSATEIVFVDSNIEACKFLLKDKNQNSMAITNKLCADFFDLYIVKILRDAINMPWISFIRKY